MSALIAFLLLVIIGLLVVIYRKIPTARSWAEQTADTHVAHDAAIDRSDALWEEQERIRHEPEWRNEISEKVFDEAERRLRARGVIR
jgi:hypothetical protein